MKLKTGQTCWNFCHELNTRQKQIQILTYMDNIYYVYVEEVWFMNRWISDLSFIFALGNDPRYPLGKLWREKKPKKVGAHCPHLDVNIFNSNCKENMMEICTLKPKIKIKTPNTPSKKNPNVTVNELFHEGYPTIYQSKRTCKPLQIIM